MTRRASPRLEAYAVLAAIGLVASLVLRRPELAAAAAPFALLLTVGTQLARGPKLDVEFAVADERTLEGAGVDAEIVVRSDVPIDRLELLLDLPPGVTTEGSDAFAVRLRGGEERRIPLQLRCARWGLYEAGSIEVRARDPLRLVVWEERVERVRQLKAYPRP